MGTHPNVPSKVLSTGVTLLDHLSANPQLSGDRVIKHFGSDLPFLFKVLAVHKALSIQAHPNKKLAEKLHSERRSVYKGELGLVLYSLMKTLMFLA
jgi:mannose-6-phosphate isomerase